MSQPALSAQVAQLEHVLGVQLFERTTRRVRATEEGRPLLEAMAAIVLAADDLESLASAAREPSVVRLRFGVIHTLAPYVVPPLVRSLADELPLVRSEWVEGLTADLEHQIERGDLDLALTATPPPDGLIDHRLGDDPFSLVVARAATDAPTRLEQVAPDRLLLLDEGHCLRDQALSACGREVGSAGCRATSLSTLVQLVSADLGVTLLPATALRVEAGHAAIRVVPIAGPAPTRTVRAVWRPSSSRLAVLAAVAATARRVLGTLTG